MFLIYKRNHHCFLTVALLLKEIIMMFFLKWVAVHFEAIEHSSMLKKKEKKIEVEEKNSFYNENLFQKRMNDEITSDKRKWFVDEENS